MALVACAASMLNDFAPSGEMDTEQLEKASISQLAKAIQIKAGISFMVFVLFLLFPTANN